MKVFVIASGSKGNCTYIEANNFKFIIDAGISYKRIANALAVHQKSICDLDAVFITHEHSDHIQGLALVVKNTRANIYLTKGVFLELVNKNELLKNALGQAMLEDRVKILLKNPTKKNYYEVVEQGVTITPVEIFHDAIEPVGYIVSFNNRKLVMITDTGYVHQNLLPLIANADCYILECNHDPQILMNSDRDYRLKMRILSNHGHLSNEDALYVLSQVISERTKKVFYAHISEDCNLFEIIDLTRKKVFSDLGIDATGIDFYFTSQVPCEVIEL